MCVCMYFAWIVECARRVNIRSVNAINLVSSYIMAIHNGGEWQTQNSNYQWFGFSLCGPFVSCTIIYKMATTTSSIRIFSALKWVYLLAAAAGAIQWHKHATTETVMKTTILMVDRTKWMKKTECVYVLIYFFSTSILFFFTVYLFVHLLRG